MTTRIRTIVVGVAALTEQDPATPGGGDPVLAPAVELARRLDATLHVVNVFELPYPVLTAYASYVPCVDPEFQEQYRRDLLARLERQVEPFGYGKIRCHAVEGSAGRALVELAARVHADLVVVGATRRGRLWRNLLGTTADRVIRGSTAPVLVLHQPFAAPVRRVLLTTDLSPEGAMLYDRGVQTAAAMFGGGLELRALMVVWFDVILPPPLKEDALEAAARDELERFVAVRAGAGAVEPRVRFGEAAREIVNEAGEWKADLIVLGTHGRSGFSRLALGSTAAATLRGAGCNVLVVPRATVPVAAEEPAREPAAAALRVPALVV